MTKTTIPRASVTFHVNTAIFFADIMQKHEETQAHFNTTGTPNNDLETEVFKGLQDLAISPAPEAGAAAYHLALICRSYDHGRPYSNEIAKEIGMNIGKKTEAWFQCAIDHNYHDALIHFAEFIGPDQPKRANDLNHWAAQLGYWQGMAEIIREGIYGRGVIANNGTDILVWGRKLHQSDAPDDVKTSVINLIASIFERDRNRGMADDFTRAAITAVLPNPTSPEQPDNNNHVASLEDLRNGMPG